MLQLTITRRQFLRTAGIAASAFALQACAPRAPLESAETAAPPPPAPTTQPHGSTSRADGLSDEEAATLDSLVKVNDHPLYTLRYHGPYEDLLASQFAAPGGGGCERCAAESQPAWACSLFAALGDAGNQLYGRNFDWEPSPAVLLFTDPPGGYASVSMVDIAYLGFTGDRAQSLLDLPLVDRRRLLAAPSLPFDGMNERGLAIGMAAVPPGSVTPDPRKETTGSLTIIRRMLDQAATVDEALDVLGRYNIDMQGGPPVHYLLADRSGHAALVEFYQGKAFIIRNEEPWHQATNFLRSATGENAEGQCWRYDRIHQRLNKTQGRLTTGQALDLLREVAQDITQWSVVYGMSAGDVTVAMGRRYDQAGVFQL